MPQTVVEVLDHLAEADPHRPAVTCGDATLTRWQLRARSCQLARTFAAAGVTEGSYVSIALENSPEFLVAAVAAWRLGAVPQPLSPRMAANELHAILALVQPAGVVGISVGPWPQLPSTAPEQADGPLPRRVSPSYKAPTSGGSTGRPKVIVVDAPAIADQLLPFAGLLLMPADGVVLIPGPLHHNAPFMFATLGLLLGSQVLLQRRFDAEQTLRDIALHQVRWMYCVPTMMQRIWRLEPEVRLAHDLSSLEHLVHMAAPCPAWLKRAWIDWLGEDVIVEVYATTEAQAATRIGGAEWLQRPGSVGRPGLGEICVLADDGAPVPAGTVGRVWLRRGKGAPAPYYYLGSKAEAMAGGWECLGDLGYLDADGYLFLTDRDSDMMIVGGSNVYPAEVEAALDEHPLVMSSCVVGLPHVDLGAVPHAIVQVTGPVDSTSLTAFLRERLSPYKVPRSIEFTDASLRDDAGKVRRSALRAERIRATIPEPDQVVT